MVFTSDYIFILICICIPEYRKNFEWIIIFSSGIVDISGIIERFQKKKLYGISIERKQIFREVDIERFKNELHHQLSDLLIANLEVAIKDWG